MRAWYKFFVSDIEDEPPDLPISATFAEHARDIGGVQETDFYSSKEAFFNQYYFGERRIQNYGRFIGKQVVREQSVLSVGSGRCANELMLLESGYLVTCSDLERSEAYEATKRLFPRLEHVCVDILSGPSPQKYDTVLSLSMIYLFGDEELARFFRNVHGSLTEGGHLVLDQPGSPDNLLSYMVHDVLLKYEQKMIRMIRLAKAITRRKRPVLIKKHFGYRRTDGEFLGTARACGFELVSQVDYDFLTEFERSDTLRRLMRGLPFTKRLLEWLGRAIPYTRMYDLRKV